MSIAIITSGGDAPGMNACIRAVVRTALKHNIEVVGFKRGYQGILDDDGEVLTRTSVSDIIQRGGTFLQTDRCEDFKKPEYRQLAYRNLLKHNCQTLIVIGGDGSFTGAKLLCEETPINVICIPGTIDNDFGYTDFSLGFDTAVNNVLWAINSLRDTMQSHNKVTVVEVMGRNCGDIALHAGIAGGAEYILVPEVPVNTTQIAEEINDSYSQGKKSNLIVLAEGAMKMEDLAQELQQLTGIVPRQTRLGFIQRGGSPTYKDRFLACEFGLKAIELIVANERNKAIGIKDGKIISMDIAQSLDISKEYNKTLFASAQLIK